MKINFSRSNGFMIFGSMIFLTGLARGSEEEYIEKGRWNLKKNMNLSIPQKFEGIASSLDFYSYCKESNKSEYYNANSVLLKENQEAMVSIPGHAQYFVDKIAAAKKKNEERLNHYVKIPKDRDWSLAMDAWSEYGEAARENIHILGLIPSVDSVTALINYVMAEKQQGDPAKGIFIGGPPRLLAIDALAGLIADGPPFTDKSRWPESSDDDIPLWRQWYEDVQNKKRTFRFVGSKISYTFEGSADEKTLERIRNESPSARAKQHLRRVAEAPGQPGPPKWVYVTAILLLVLAAPFCWMKRKNVI